MFSLTRLRRPSPITTSTAPTLGPGIDVPSTPPRPATPPVVPVAEVHFPQRPGPVEDASRSLDSAPAAAVPAQRSLSTMPAHSSLPAGPPGWTPGRCYHPVHVDLDGRRYGLLPEPGDNPQRGTLLRCAHINPDGC